jgi:hypothetical protein
MTTTIIDRSVVDSKSPLMSSCVSALSRLPSRYGHLPYTKVLANHQTTRPAAEEISELARLVQNNSDDDELKRVFFSVSIQL